MKEFIDNLKLAWFYTKDQKWKLLLYIFFNIISSVIFIIAPIYYSKIIVYITDSDFYQMLLMALILFGIDILKSFSRYFVRYFSQIMYSKSFSKIQTELARETLKLNNESLDNFGSGVFLRRLGMDASNSIDVFSMLTDYTTNLATYIGKYIAIFIINKPIFFFILISTLIMGYVDKIRARKYKEYDKKFRTSHEKSNGFISELVKGARDIKMLNAEKSFIKEFESRIVDTNELRFGMQSLGRRYFLFEDLAYGSVDFLMVVLLVILMIKNTLSPTSAIIIWNYTNGIFYITSFIGNIFDRINDFNLSASRVFEIINGKDFKKETFGTKHLDKINGDFEFKNVSFSYGKVKVLKDLSFKVFANETVAFVGKSGAGKTTIFNLLCKMYEPTKGTIKIDGINIKKLDKNTIRGNITVISQNPYIFNMTIKDNLKLVKENVTEEEIIEACKLSCLHDYIMTLPNKYDTIIGEGGVNLSGGQKQRLAIARALIQKTEIILFDEATSALDNETQAKIQNAIENMKGEYTILIIAHRLSTIKNASRIIFINDGKVEKEGTHEYLLKSCPNYKHLYESEIKKSS